MCVLVTYLSSNIILAECVAYLDDPSINTVLKILCNAVHIKTQKPSIHVHINGITLVCYLSFMPSFWDH